MLNNDESVRGLRRSAKSLFFQVYKQKKNNDHVFSKIEIQHNRKNKAKIAQSV